MTGYGHSWHQSHDQATVLLLVPYDTLPEDLIVQIEKFYIVAGVRDQPPLIKGRVYGTLVPGASSWQLEPRTHHQHNHERARTTSTASTASNASSYAIISSDAEISSSFAASLASGRQSVADDYAHTSPYPHQAFNSNSPPLSSPASHSHTPLHQNSRPTSPRLTTSSWASSLSSRSSLQLQLSRAGRLLTIYLEKADSVIWPSIIIGPVPVHVYAPLPAPPGATDVAAEERYNMDAVSLGVLGVEQIEAGRRDDAFEYLVRAWHQSHTPVSTLHLTSYLPPSAPVHIIIDSDPEPGTSAYYLLRMGGLPGLARLYLEAGLLYLEGVADTYLNSSSKVAAATESTDSEASASISASAENEKWRQEKEIARKFFDRARVLDPYAEIPILPPDPVDDASAFSPSDKSGDELRMPDVSVLDEGVGLDTDRPRRRRRKPEESMVDQVNKGSQQEDTEAGWYLYLPGLIGAGTALLAVGLIGAMSLGSWRKSQSS